MSNSLSGLKSSIWWQASLDSWTDWFDKSQQPQKRPEREAGADNSITSVPLQSGWMDRTVLVRQGFPHFCHFILHFPDLRNIKVLMAKGWYAIQEDWIPSTTRHTRRRIPREEACVLAPKTPSTLAVSWAYSCVGNVCNPGQQWSWGLIGKRALWVHYTDSHTIGLNAQSDLPVFYIRQWAP